MASADTDPWDWSADTVIAYLCRDPGPLFPKFESIIKKADLETSIRDNYLTGECLLQLTDTQIETLLGTKAIGPQIHCRNDVQQLQKQSTEWLNRRPHNLMLEQTRSVQLPSIVSSSDLVSMDTMQTPQDLLTHDNMAQAKPKVGPKRINPVLLTSRKSNGLSNSEIAVADHYQPQTDNGNYTATSSSRGSFIADEDNDQDHVSNWRELMNSVKLPQVPEHLFFRHESQTVENQVAESVKKGKSKTEQSQGSEHRVSETAEYKTLKEIEATQITTWQATKLPQLELKAYQLWSDAKDKQAMQYYCRQKIEKLQNRLRRLENEVLISSGRDLKRMADSLSPTVVDIAAWQWKLKLYRLARQPEKPLIQTTKKPKKRKVLDPDDEIDLSSEDWDDFIDDEEDDYDDDEGRDKDSGNAEDSIAALNKAQSIQTAQTSNTDSAPQIATTTRSPKSATPGPGADPKSLPDNSLALVLANPLKKNPDVKEEATNIRYNQLPPYHDLDAWKREGPACAAYLIANKKQELLMAWNIAHQLEGWKTVSPHVSEQSNSNFLWSKLASFLKIMLRPNSVDVQVLRQTDAHIFDAMVQIAVWYTLWHCMGAVTTEGLPRGQIKSAMRSTKDYSGRASFGKFWRTLQDIKRHWMTSQTTVTPARSVPQFESAVSRSQSS